MRLRTFVTGLAAALSLMATPAPAVLQTSSTPPVIGERSAPLPERATRRPPARRTEKRCTEDRRHCIGVISYGADICRAISAAATDAGIDADFFARLLWRESLFDANAVSPAGAQGIAQFMPGTALLRRLDDPFNPAAAIFASAHYLAELTEVFGSEGLAAAAYNAGEARLADFAAGRRGLPPETRAYVAAITGHSGVTWRDSPPAEIDYRLDPERGFEEACRRMAAGKSVRRFRDPEPPWGVIVAAGTRRATVERFAARLRREHPDLLSGPEMRIVDAVIPGFGTRPRLTAQLAAASREEASDLCRLLRRKKVFCRVNRN
ncbi:Transglycosylase [Profundibacterium mesophilum KAUST100406-0324]|uniref:Transglycosylase n=2 Tax=Profundibacterium TaxID=1258570 RepID=A0A921TCH0_9RHOB|nr:Transglycosylase [Profundibacterium mesophilum KAUST100406-0324]